MCSSVREPRLTLICVNRGRRVRWRSRPQGPALAPCGLTRSCPLLSLHALHSQSNSQFGSVGSGRPSERAAQRGPRRPCALKLHGAQAPRTQTGLELCEQVVQMLTA